jgi:hypothetical protein
MLQVLCWLSCASYAPWFYATMFHALLSDSTTHALLQVQTYDGKVHKAQAFVSATLAKLYNEVQPTEQYMRKLRDGAADNYLEPQYQVRCSAALLGALDPCSCILDQDLLQTIKWAV